MRKKVRKREGRRKLGNQSGNGLWRWFLPAIICVVVVVEVIFVSGEISNIQKNLNALKESTKIGKQDKTKEEKKEATTVKTAKKTTNADKITLTFVGDIMCYDAQRQEAYNESDETYDFSKAFEQVKPYLKKADLTIGNLETVLGGEEIGYKGYPLFNTPDAFAKALKDVGFDVVTTANNHTFDQGATGVKNTLDALDEIGIDAVGSYRTSQEKDKILVKKVNGWKIAFVSFTYGQNVENDEVRQYFNYLTEEEIKSQMKKAREQNPDIIVAMPHWGEEFSTTVNDSQKEFAELFIKEGADLIIGSHPHVLQTMKKKEATDKDGKTKQVFIAYSMGNFFTNQSEEYSLDEMILTLTIKKGKNGINVSKVEDRAAYMAKPGIFDTIDHYQVLDITSYKRKLEQNQDEMDEALYSTLSESEQIEKRLTEEN